MKDKIEAEIENISDLLLFDEAYISGDPWVVSDLLRVKTNTLVVVVLYYC